MTADLDLGFDFPADDGALQELSNRIWSAPAVPVLRHVPRRLKHAAGWAPFRNNVLIRTVDEESGRWEGTIGLPRPGGRIHFHLGCVSEQPWPETRRLIRKDGRYLTLAEFEPVEPGMVALGFIGTVPFPMLVALEERRMPDGQYVLVSGDADPLRAQSEAVGTLGWVEPFPLLPRESPDPGHRLLVPLFRWLDLDLRAHAYGTGADAGGHSGAVCLGSVVRTSPTGGAAITLERLRALRSPSLPARASIVTRARWALAPLTWEGFGRRRRLTGAMERLRMPASRLQAGPSETDMLGYLSAEPSPGYTPLLGAFHPVTGDWFVTRSAVEAGDLGYLSTHLLGWISDVAADRAAGQDAVRWAYRHGGARRYLEPDRLLDDALPSCNEAPMKLARVSQRRIASTALLEARSAAGLAGLGVPPGATAIVDRRSAQRAIAVAVRPAEASLLALVAAPQRRCAARCGCDYVVVALDTDSDRQTRIAEVDDSYEIVRWLMPTAYPIGDCDPFLPGGMTIIQPEHGLAFADQRRRLLEIAAEQGLAEEVQDNQR